MSEEQKIPLTQDMTVEEIETTLAKMSITILHQSKIITDISSLLRPEKIKITTARILSKQINNLISNRLSLLTNILVEPKEKLVGVKIRVVKESPISLAQLKQQGNSMTDKKFEVTGDTVSSEPVKDVKPLDKAKDQNNTHTDELGSKPNDAQEAK
jgi:hypothetical protein